MKKLLAIFALMFVLGPASAQLPPPINLGIINLPQNGPVWCWAAVARQIIAWKHQNLLAAPEGTVNLRVRGKFCKVTG